MIKYTCKTCGVTQNIGVKPKQCPICKDSRQNQSEEQQQWVNLEDYQNKFQTSWQNLEPNLYRISIDGDIGIGQDAHLLQTDNGNYLWDSIPLINDKLVEKVHAKGGLKAIVISHPHFYSNMATWSKTFGNIPIYIHANDTKWVQEKSDNTIFWQGETLELEENITLINCKGHFDGSTVLHYRGDSPDGSFVLAGDTIAPIKGNKNVIFRHSFTQDIRLSKDQVSYIAKVMKPYTFSRLYGAFGSDILNNAAKIVQSSTKLDLAER